MIFKQWQQVLDGTKTQTRRLVSGFDRLGLHDYGVEKVETVMQRFRDRDWPCRYGIWRLKWVVGRTYAVQPGRGKKAVGCFRITEVRQERLQDISEEDAIAEGWPEHLELFPEVNREWKTREWFRRLWDDIHKKSGTRWEDDPEVWVLTFEMAH